jgi:hypothetical protein
MYYSKPEYNSATAKSYYDVGLNVIPLWLNGSKVPKVDWSDGKGGQLKYPWETLQPYFGEVELSGIGILCGPTSNNLYLFDCDQFRCYPAWADHLELRRPGLLKKLVIDETPKGGRHLWAYVPITEGNLTLAQSKDSKIIFETRGKGGLGVAVGSPLSTHSLCKPYRSLQGSMLSIPTITPEDWQCMCDIARGFNVYEKPKGENKPPRQKPKIDPEHDKAIRELLGDCYLPKRLLPGQDFNNRADWRNILEPHGWTLRSCQGGEGRWRKPHSTSPEHHATTNYNGNNLLYIFSTGIPGFEAGRPYSKFEAFAILTCGGDRKLAYKELSQQGYGD